MMSEVKVTGKKGFDYQVSLWDICDLFLREEVTIFPRIYIGFTLKKEPTVSQLKQMRKALLDYSDYEFFCYIEKNNKTAIRFAKFFGFTFFATSEYLIYERKMSWQ